MLGESFYSAAAAGTEAQNEALDPFVGESMEVMAAVHVER